VEESANFVVYCHTKKEKMQKQENLTHPLETITNFKISFYLSDLFLFNLSTRTKMTDFSIVPSEK